MTDWTPTPSHIEGNLWLGGFDPFAPFLDEDYRFVVSLYPWGKYRIGPDTIRDEYKLHDTDAIPDVRQLHQIADSINEYRATGKTLVHCQAGWNRSGLVTALALIKSGMEPAEAINMLRVKRHPMVLCNETFAQWLLKQGKVLR